MSTHIKINNIILEHKIQLLRFLYAWGIESTVFVFLIYIIMNTIWKNEFKFSQKKAPLLIREQERSPIKLEQESWTVSKERVPRELLQNTV